MPDVDVGLLSDDLIESFRGALDLVARERLYLAFSEAPPLSAVRQFLSDGAEKGDTRLVAVAEGHVVGWCDISRYAVASKAHRGTLGMAVTPAWRGRGIGLRLLTKALEHAWSTRFTRVQLEVYADNAPAIALYRKVGFVDEGMFRDAVYIDGRYRDALAMALLRRPVN